MAWVPSRRTELLNILTYLPHPGDRNILVCPYNTIELVSSLVGDDGRVLGICKTRIRIDMGQERVDVVFEHCNDYWVGVKLRGLGREGGLRSSDIIPRPSEEGKFPTVIVVLIPSARCYTI